MFVVRVEILMMKMMSVTNVVLFIWDQLSNDELHNISSHRTSLLADDTDDGIGLCGWILTAISWAMVVATLPFSLCVCFKVSLQDYYDNLHNRKLFTFCTQNKLFTRYFQVVQEYERAVIFRLGRLLSGGSKGPGKPLSSIVVLISILIPINTVEASLRWVIFPHRDWPDDT